MSTPNYITPADLQALFTAKEVADLTASGVDGALIVSLANEEVHRYIAPLIGTAILAEVPLALKMKAADLARFYLYTDVVGEDSPVMIRWKASVRSLERIAEGKETVALKLVDNPATEGDDVADASGVWSESGPNTLPASEFGSSFW